MNNFVKDFYDSNAEVELERLDLPLCRIEFASTLRLIDKYLPKRGRVCDIGGGPGRYTVELIRRGFVTTLVDVSDIEIHLARTRLDELGLSAEQLLVCDAQDLSPFASESFEEALLLGPMYHLIEPAGRASALRELARVLKPGGRAIIAYLNSWGLIKTGIVDFPNHYQEISILRSMLGERSFPGRRLSNCVESYWSTPEIAFAEVEAAGFDILSHAGAESFANGMGVLLEKLAANQPDAYANVVEVAADTCELEQYRDSTDHLHIVVAKRGLS
jgi:ubiquinone/menaquinone biosynthesis C-methylase UbiE